MNSLLEQLNDSQRIAVEYVDGPQLVIAGAGSGKTRVLTYKIAYLLQMGMKPWNILALTFTNKAAKEMKQRIGNLVGHELARSLNMGTFHSVFSRILRVEAERIGYKPNFTIYDETDSRSLLKNIMKEMGLDEKKYKPASVHNRISMAKNKLITPAKYSADPQLTRQDIYTQTPAIGQVYEAYQQRCKSANAMDFDDLLVLTYQLFNNHEDIRMKYAQRFQYVLVDEYQDTNYAQQCIILQLTKEHQHICVVGDDAQSNYAFRGANIDNNLNFQKIFPSAKLHKLEQNYRSTQRIVKVANSLIRHNSQQIQKDVFSENDEGEKIVFKQAYSDKEEAAIVCNDIKSIKRNEKCQYSDFAILYRTNAQSRSFEEMLLKENIPYRIYGGMGFYQRKEIKDVLAYFRLVANPDDEEAFKRIINYPTRGIGTTTINKVIGFANERGISLWEAIQLEGFVNQFNNGTRQKLNNFVLLISSFISQIVTKDVYELGKQIIKESGISADIFSESTPEAVSRQENLEEFLSSMNAFVDEQREEGLVDKVYLIDFLQEISLMTDIDDDNDNESRVSLMTIHSAKGLEFPTVFVVGMEENIFPSPMCTNTLRELEEERRLLYVAITRAEKHCTLTCAKNRLRFGKMEMNPTSRFIKDIDPRLMTVEGGNRGFSSNSFSRFNSWEDNFRQSNKRIQNSRPVATQFMADAKPKITAPQRQEQAVDPFSERFKQRLQASGGNLKRVEEAIKNGGRTLSQPSSTSVGTLQEGANIEHQRFGIGKVLKIEGTGENTKATVEFKNTGIKQLLLKFAKFNIIK
ncbi:MAG: UvrD-helicase domain-containing protein [Prevotella sp.]|nr:UvrD-helicase domain-containing protein [Prevotella sp.]